MALNSNWNELATTTLNLWCATDFANVFSSHSPLWYRLRQQKNIQTGGLGLKALEPFEYPDVNGPQVEGVSDPYAEMTPAETYGWTNAEYTWCEKRLSVSIPELTMDLQGSDTQKINHLNAVKDISVKKFLENLNLDLWRGEGAVGAGGASRQYLGSLRAYLNRGDTGTVNPGSVPAPLANQLYAASEPGGAAIGTSPLTMVGGIERNSAQGAYWCTPLYVPGNADTMTQAALNYVYNLAVRNNDYPDLIVMGRNNYGALMAILQGYQRYTDGDLADAGFMSMKYMGADVVFDDNCPANSTAGQVFFINTKYIKLRCATLQPKFEYKPDPNRTILNWNARWVGQITSGNLGRVHSRHGKIGSA